MEEQPVVNNPIQQPNTKTPPQPKHHTFLTSKLFLITFAIIIFILLLVIGGNYMRNLQLQKQMVPPSPEPPLPSKITLQPSTNQDETANWKTYIHKKFGYSFKYPLSLEIRSFDINIDLVGSSIISIYDPSTNEFLMIINSRSYEQKTSFPEAINGVFVTEPNKQGINTFVDGHPAFYTSSESTVKGGEKYKAYNVIIQQNDLNYKILTSNGIFLNKNENDKIIFDQILSTFKFTN